MKNKKIKIKIKIISILTVIISLIASFLLGYNIKTKDRTNLDIGNNKKTIEITASKEKYSGKKPKYIFLFIGATI